MQEVKKTVFLGLSGGLDSTTLLANYLYEGSTVYPVFFKYPSKHNSYELDAAVDVSYHYGVTLRIINIGNLFTYTNSGLFVDAGDDAIKLGEYCEDTIITTVVPGRNLIFASILASMAQSEGRSTIALGVHSGDHILYPDCREDWIVALDNIIGLQSENIARVDAPFLTLTKKDIAYKAKELGVPIHMTRSCYSSEGKPCGLCSTCIERDEAIEWAEAKYKAFLQNEVQ